MINRGRLAILVLAACLSASGRAADSVSGLVRNQTRNRPAAGDDVILLRLDQGMQEEARTKTDDNGAFIVKVRFLDKPYLVRVMHQGVNYDERAAVGAALSIEVFDAAPKVPGVTGNIEIIRVGNKAGNQGDFLHVSDMIEIKNNSSPPVTQAGERTFEVFLPARAKIDSVMAAGPGKIGTIISPSPVSGESGHYTVNFPLRPGSTKFVFNYDLPYNGRASFRIRLAYPVLQLAVMIPPTMKFASRSSAFRPLPTGSRDYQVQATKPLTAGEGPVFEISGNGFLPPLQARSQQPPAPQAHTAPNPSMSAMGASQPQTPATSEARSASAPAASALPSANEWWIVGAAGVLVFGACAFLIWRTVRQSVSKAESTRKPAASAGTPSPLLDALKERLLELETRRLEGSISLEEYDAAKRALELTVKRALAQSVTNI